VTVAPSREQLALFLFTLYVLDLVWKLFHWQQLTAGVPWWTVVMALAVRSCFMGGLLYVYLQYRKNQSIKNSDSLK
jgi:hypothetical protein